MRTTLDIDDDVLAAAKERAAAEKSTAGKVISNLVRQALTRRAGDREPEFRGGFRLLPRADKLITKEDIDRSLEQADIEDAGIAGIVKDG
jgi:Arc/MetJ family transcription regulator